MTNHDIYDAAIVGAGLSGALVAHHLAEASLNVLVLEARESPGGIASRGSGLALLGTPEPYSTLRARLGDDAGRQIWALTHRNLDLLAAIHDVVNLPYPKVGSTRVATGEDGVEALRQSAVLLKQDLYSVDVDSTGEQISIRTTDDRAFDPDRLIHALLDHPNITVECQTEVQSISPHASVKSDAGPVLTVWAHKRAIWTHKVVVTGGAHAVRLDPYLATIVRPLAMHAIDVRCDAALPTPRILHDGQVVIRALDGYWRLAGWSDGTRDLLSMLIETGGELCPEAPVAQRYSWWAAQSRDDLPVVGALPSTPNVYTINGLGPWGTSWVFVAADMLASMIIHQESGGMLALERLLAA